MARSVKKQPRLGRPPSVLSADTRRRIADAAEKCFALNGYDKTTNKDIADEAGLTSGALYHYFDSKQSLYLTILAEHQQMVLARFTDLAATESHVIDKLCAI